MSWSQVKIPDVLFFQEGPGVRNTQFTNFKHIRTNKNGTRVYSAKIELLKNNTPKLENRLRNLKRNSNNESSNFEN